ncbi:hypothetical protein BKA93DRAFT_754382 [Sparassis latifolia]
MRPTIVPPHLSHASEPSACLKILHRSGSAHRSEDMLDWLDPEDTMPCGGEGVHTFSVDIEGPVTAMRGGESTSVMEIAIVGTPSTSFSSSAPPGREIIGTETQRYNNAAVKGECKVEVAVDGSLQRDVAGRQPRVYCYPYPCSNTALAATTTCYEFSHGLPWGKILANGQGGQPSPSKRDEDYPIHSQS